MNKYVGFFKVGHYYRFKKEYLEHLKRDWDEDFHIFLNDNSIKCVLIEVLDGMSREYSPDFFRCRILFEGQKRANGYWIFEEENCNMFEEVKKFHQEELEI